MKKKLFAIGLASTLAAGAHGTSYLGSVVNSWNASYRIGWLSYHPIGLVFGDGHIWVSHEMFFVKREPATGSVLDVLGFTGPSGEDLGYEADANYLYFASGGPYVYVRDSATASTIRTFATPTGVERAFGLDFDDAAPSKPAWLSDRDVPRVWNLTSTGSVVMSVGISFGSVSGLAYDGDTAGGPFLFAGTAATTPTVYALNAASGSIRYSFRAPVFEGGLRALSWDGIYLWTIDRGRGSPSYGYVFQFVAHEPNVGVVPGSLGRIKALYR